MLLAYLTLAAHIIWPNNEPERMVKDAVKALFQRQVSIRRTEKKKTTTNMSQQPAFAPNITKKEFHFQYWSTGHYTTFMCRYSKVQKVYK
jgi:hypothetical protein